MQLWVFFLGTSCIVRNGTPWEWWGGLCSLRCGKSFPLNVSTTWACYSKKAEHILIPHKQCDTDLEPGQGFLWIELNTGGVRNTLNSPCNPGRLLSTKEMIYLLFEGGSEEDSLSLDQNSWVANRLLIDSKTWSVPLEWLLFIVCSFIIFCRSCITLTGLGIQHWASFCWGFFVLHVVLWNPGGSHAQKGGSCSAGGPCKAKQDKQSHVGLQWNFCPVKSLQEWTYWLDESTATGNCPF